jgi:hypothetical protein
MTTHFLPFATSSLSSLSLFVWSVEFGAVVLPYPASVMILMNHEGLLFPVLEFKEYIIDPDAGTDFSGPDIYPCLDIPQEWSPKDKLYT